MLKKIARSFRFRPRQSGVCDIDFTLLNTADTSNDSAGFRPKQVRKEMDVLSQEESIRFLKALEGERFEMIFSFALATGMRVQEYLALQWKDINFERGTAVVQRAVVRH